LNKKMGIFDSNLKISTTTIVVVRKKTN